MAHGLDSVMMRLPNRGPGLGVPQQAVEFLLFDIGSCIQPDVVPPAAP